MVASKCVVTPHLLLLVFLVVALLCPSCDAATKPMQPLADPAAITVVGNARFTVLTSHILRLEWSASQQWQDSASWAVNYRLQPVPAFDLTHNATHTVITTSALTLEYLTDSPASFNSDNVRVTVRSPQAVWTAGNHEELNNGRMPGTIGALDGTNGISTVQLDCQYDQYENGCTYGVISRGGYAIIDDTHAPLFDNGSWPWLVRTHYDQPSQQQCAVDSGLRRDCATFAAIDSGTCLARGCCYDAQSSPACFYAKDADQDLYFFGHGHDYKLALKEFTAIAGPIPMPPRYALGLWFSRYWSDGQRQPADTAPRTRCRCCCADVLTRCARGVMSGRMRRTRRRRSSTSSRVTTSPSTQSCRTWTSEAHSSSTAHLSTQRRLCSPLLACCLCCLVASGI